MPKLFETTTINTMTLNNRFIRSATWEGMAHEDGSCTQKLIDLVVKLAQGNTGLIITGYAFISRDGQAAPWQLGAYSDDLLPGLSDMAEAIHKIGGKIVLQIAHGGLFANPELTGQEAIGPSVAWRSPISR